MKEKNSDLDFFKIPVLYLKIKTFKKIPIIEPNIKTTRPNVKAISQLQLKKEKLSAQRAESFSIGQNSDYGLTS